ncbi:MAG: bifunctional demethylmenaquinone methyltransferase/2-methoxy-6-polyprenyl-1,4-benzoquinol methylase UbiE [Bacteroidales bacterium]|nr:bifunctional demethylmenaquinone methyltransferase/2-methoxy-6-polyprenyl-1,4-benzoquinol methylase UbiE [Bacteroidales bacterium]
MFDQIAYRYDMINHILSLGTDRIWRRKAAGMLARYQPDTILDVACGTADSTIAIHHATGSSKITGIDISEEMLQIGQKKVLMKQLSGKITLTNCRAEQICFADSSFDAAAVLFGIRNFQDRDQALHEMHRVLKPQGVLLIVEFSLPRSRLVNILYKSYFLHILPVIGGFLSGNVNAYRYFVQSVREFPEPFRFCGQLENHGFTIQTSRQLTFGIAWIYLVKKMGSIDSRTCLCFKHKILFSHHLR